MQRSDSGPVTPTGPSPNGGSQDNPRDTGAEGEGIKSSKFHFDVNSLLAALLGLVGVLLAILVGLVGSILTETFALKEQFRQLSVEVERQKGDSNMTTVETKHILEIREEKTNVLMNSVKYWSAEEFGDICNLAGGTYHFDTKSCTSEKGKEVRYIPPFDKSAP